MKLEKTSLMDAFTCAGFKCEIVEDAEGNKALINLEDPKGLATSCFMSVTKTPWRPLRESTITLTFENGWKKNFGFWDGLLMEDPMSGYRHYQGSTKKVVGFVKENMLEIGSPVPSAN